MKEEVRFYHGRRMFSDYEKSFIKEHAKDMSDQEIAEALGRSVPSIRRYKNENMIVSKKTLSQFHNDIVRMISEGFGNREIAESLGRPYGSVYCYIKRYRLR